MRKPKLRSAPFENWDWELRGLKRPERLRGTRSGLSGRSDMYNLLMDSLYPVVDDSSLLYILASAWDSVMNRIVYTPRARFHLFHQSFKSDL